MILPFRTSIRPRRTPYANYALMAVNVLIFLVSYRPVQVVVGRAIVVEPLRSWAQPFMLTPLQPYLWQFVSYAFLHGSFVHIFGNMFFLYLFGNNVNDKLGNLGYLCFYLSGAVFSGIGHTLIHSSAVLGASGGVAAVTGAYLVLFPQSLITVFYWLFFFIGTTEILALYFIGFKMIFLDNMITRYTPNVAYDAHLSGYAFGIGATLTLLATGLVSGSTFDLWAMIRRWNQRRRYRDVVASGYDPFTGQQRLAKQIKVKEIEKTPAQKAQEEKIMRLRGEIAERIRAGNLAAAAEAYMELKKLDEGQILPRQYLLDIANQLMAAGDWAESAAVYEKFLTHYSSYEYAEQVQLMLGILYSRYLHNKEAAVKYLGQAREKLSDAEQLKMCNEELGRLEKK